MTVRGGCWPYRGVYEHIRTFRVLAEGNARGFVRTMIRAEDEATYIPFGMLVVRGYRFTFDPDNFPDIGADSIEYVRLAGEFNGFDPDNRDFALVRQSDGTWAQEFTIEKIMDGYAEYEGQIDIIDHEDYIDFKWIVNGRWAPAGFGNNLKVDDSEEGVEVITGEVNPYPVEDDFVDEGDEEEEDDDIIRVAFYFRMSDWATEGPNISFNNEMQGIEVVNQSMRESTYEGWYMYSARYSRERLDNPDGRIFFNIVFWEGEDAKTLYADGGYNDWVEFRSSTGELWIDASNPDYLNWEENFTGNYWLDTRAYRNTKPDF